MMPRKKNTPGLQRLRRKTWSGLTTCATVAGAIVMAATLAMTLAPPVAAVLAPSPEIEWPLLAAVAGSIAALAVWPVVWLVCMRRVDRAERALLLVRRELTKAKRAAQSGRRRDAADFVDLVALAKANREGRASADQVIRMFLETSPGAADRLRSAIEEGDPDGVSRHARRLQTASRDVGALELPSMLADVEALARAGDIGGMHAAANEIGRAFEDLTLALKTLNARG